MSTSSSKTTPERPACSKHCMQTRSRNRHQARCYEQHVCCACARAALARWACMIVVVLVMLTPPRAPGASCRHRSRCVCESPHLASPQLHQHYSYQRKCSSL
eukprot:6176449-Pleurochrysis_carterae.AAC.1